VALGLAIAGLLAVFSGGLLLITAGTASSTPTGADQTCVPSQPWTETIEHPAVSHTETVVVVDEEAWTETIPAVAELWQNFSPNNQQQKFEGPPDWPDDPRGTWQHIDKPIPPGHQGPDGVYQRGEGNGSWFYRRAAVPEHVIDKPAWTETVEHPAVVCPGPTEPTTEPTTEPPEVEPSTGQASEEPDEPEVLGEQETAEPASQAEVPTVVDAGLAGPPSEERWGAPLLVGGLLLLTSSGAVAAARRRA
jgi:hypothetical protein